VLSLIRLIKMWSKQWVCCKRAVIERA